MNNPLTESEIIELGFRAGFRIDYDQDESKEYGFINAYGEVDNEPFIRLVRLIEKAKGE